MRPRVFALAFAFVLPLATIASMDAPRGSWDPVASADAAVAVELSLEELVNASTFVVVGTADEKKSLWEDLPHGRRIVTYTRIHVERTLAGRPGTDVWVRTLGGSVDKIGQSVPGEAQLALGSRSVLFLANDGATVAVTALAQGHYRLTEGKPPRLSAADAGSLLLPRRGPTIPARERLQGTTVDEAANAVKQAQRGTDGSK